MALTGWEAGKVLFGIGNEICIEAEKFENEHPGERYHIEKGEIVSLVIEIGQKLGVEILD